MLQQTQVKTVIPYFVKFIKKIPSLKILSNTSEKKVLKLWEGLGYYRRAKNLLKASKILIKLYKGRIPKKIENLKRLPGVGDYTANALLAIIHNYSYIPIDGNVKRVFARLFYLDSNDKDLNKKITEIRKQLPNNNIRNADLAEAFMEFGATVCKPINPLCFKCPMSDNCKSYKRKDFEIKLNNKFNKIKYFEANIYQYKDKYLLIKNNKFKFLKNLLIFPMKEVEKNKFHSSQNKKINIKMSNMNMRIVLNKKKKLIKVKNSYLLEKNKITDQVLPSFTKKIFSSVSNYS